MRFPGTLSFFKNAFFLCCSVLVFFTANANQIPIKHLGVDQGLSNSSATCITQDEYGFIWIGTYDGLNMYDGFQFKNFRNVWGDQTSLVNNKIKTIVATGDRLFVGTEKGAVYYNYKDCKFHPIYCNYGGKIYKVECNVNQMLTDNKGNLYIATNKQGLLLLARNDTAARKIGNSADIRKDGVQTIALDKKQRLWVFINWIGLGLYHPQSDQINVVNRSIISANCLTVDRTSTLWIGTNNGLFSYNENLNTIIPFEGSGRRLIADNVSSLLPAASGELWIATNGAGLNIWNPYTKVLKSLLPGESAYALQSGAVAALFEDKDQRKWIATLRGGISIVDNKRSVFKRYSRDPSGKNTFAGNFIRSFCEDDLHNIWIGTDGNGLSYWNIKERKIQNYQRSAAKGSLTSNYVVSIVKDHQNQIWIATFNGGIDAFDRHSRTFKHYTCYKDGSKAEEKNFWKLYEDSKHRLWAASTWGGALYLYNRELDRFEIFDSRLADMHTLFEDGAGALWGGDYVHLVKIDANAKKHQYYPIGQAVRAIAEDLQGHLWIGTEGGGLLSFDRKSHLFKRYTNKDGLPNNAVLNILIDDRNRLWCSTYNGLTCFEQHPRRFHNYSVSEGLQSNQFLYNAALKLTSGEMMFGGIKGFNVFNPDSVFVTAHQPPLRLTDLTVNGTSVSNTAFADHMPLNDIHEIRVPFDQASLAIGFTALEFSFPEKVNYAYYLQGWDHRWNFIGKSREAYFSRLNEGTYLLEIKSTDTDGGWNGAPLRLKIIVLPPWYRTWWAYTLWLILLSAVVYKLWAYRKKQLTLAYEVQIANLKIEQEKEANERKLSFFTNIAHEFRTPLTLIINPVKDLLKKAGDPKDELTLVYRNARRLLGLVDHLLLFRKTENDSADLTITRINFVEFACEIYNCFVQQTKLKQITYLFEADRPEIMVSLDRVKIEIALFNLVSNAVKFTPDGGHITIRVYESGQDALFEVSDNGVGIGADVGEQLFEKYYQIKKGNALRTGFGIGLYLVKTFIESHQGTVAYQSRPGKGTVFTLSLPKVSVASPLDSSYPAEQSSGEISMIERDDFAPEIVEGEAGQLELLISDAKSILIIEDNPEISNYIRSIFSSDFTVYQAADGDTGLQMIRQFVPDIVISDIVMPGLSGIELCHVVKSDSAISHIPIILVTGEPAAGLRIKGIEEGAVDFIQKPFDKELLIARVQGVIKSKKQLQNYFYKEITLKGKTENISEEHKEFIYKCIAVIEQSLNDSSPDINTIAEKLGMSYSNFYKRIKMITGQSVSSFVRFVKLRKAAEILINTNCNVNEAAFRVGYSDLKYFREHFVKQFGVRPSDFIKRHRAAFQQNYKIVPMSREHK